MKITKKTIKEQPDFMVIIDRASEFTNPQYPIEIKPLNALTIIEAMNEAEKYIDDTIYLINIAEKTNEVIENKIVYRDILTHRSRGWHICDEKHCETPFHYGLDVETGCIKSIIIRR